MKWCAVSSAINPKACTFTGPMFPQLSHVWRYQLSICKPHGRHKPKKKKLSQTYFILDKLIIMFISHFAAVTISPYITSKHVFKTSKLIRQFWLDGLKTFSCWMFHVEKIVLHSLRVIASTGSKHMFNISSNTFHII